MNINRRKFIQSLSLASGSLLLFPACGGSQKSLWRFLTTEEAETIIAIAEQIIPADQDAGATDAGVVNFIDKQLAGFYSNFQETYRNGIAALNQYCHEKYSQPFEKLEWNKQTETLKLMEKNSIEGGYWKENPASRFFRMIRDHSMQGFYGSPRHGGNKNYVSYKMIRIDFPHVIGQNRYASRCETLNAFAK
ncbi:MAG: gluconate 2-dehydrogenase subunit 3 family protein [Bacteroidota bacterium]|nr:gluconate 2-dehydrogenase subunit 3 family protein [Bacteroidota bacterium]